MTISKIEKIDKEKRTVERMIRLYCEKKEGNQELCASCKELIAYAHARLDHCPFGEQKGMCKYCKIHCYSPQKRKEIKKVMRFAGPRMLLYAPWQVIKHWLKK
ncbi:MAG: nitrous oxide-stimulated promoter family protein [Bacteroides graminisolvens]|jgi:hypothetical protein|nr:nitrous oxide-stimulated promoter family protein [Bacteroides graminisolvens]MBP6248319.1 nitrous oxide-stimulated promoter family protein [Bacteroides sp.]MBP9496245.1 nitrous oxide-stimulated promoter family protein [Bacteroides sp.]MDD3210919.1 nitrous oxide-stimulated promoter family protein [Bacteroides graminisolvens]MDD4417263.1 nitrous oxide-stimulated promoter family protein [Bacteroides graminisolvens]MEA4885967.1 nitrous oxide-stimulated promoter family protein [Bacteroides grami